MMPAVSRNNTKNILIIIVLGIILLLFTTFLIIDWTSGGSALSFILKYCVSWFCALIALSTGKDGLDKKDRILLGTAFLFIPLADTFLVILQQFANPTGHMYFFFSGMGCFAVFHIFLIIRHSRTIMSIGKKENRKRLAYVILAFIIIFSGSFSALVWGILPLLDSSVMKSAVLIYSILLTTSLWMAWNTLALKFFPRVNAWFIALGISAHFLSDIIIILKNNIPAFYPVGEPLVWTLYAPAIVMLSLSGYKSLFTHRE